MKKTLLFATFIGLIAFYATFAICYSLGKKIEFTINPEAIKKPDTIKRLNTSK